MLIGKYVGKILYIHTYIAWINCRCIYIYICLKWSHSVVSDSLWPMDCSLPGSSVHGIFQARVLEWVTISFSRGYSQRRDRTWVSCAAGRCLTVWATRNYIYANCKSYIFFKLQNVLKKTSTQYQTNNPIKKWAEDLNRHLSKFLF